MSQITLNRSQLKQIIKEEISNSSKNSNISENEQKLRSHIRRILKENIFNKADKERRNQKIKKGTASHEDFNDNDREVSAKRRLKIRRNDGYVPKTKRYGYDESKTINKNRLRAIIKEALSHILKEDFTDDDDLNDYHTFTPNRSIRHQSDTEDNFMGGVDPSDDEFDQYGNSREEGPEYDDDPVNRWKVGDELGDNDVAKYNNALQRQKISNREVDQEYRNSGKAFDNDEFGHKYYHGTDELPSSDYEKGYDNMYNGGDNEYSFDDENENDYDSDESGWDENEFEQ